MAVIKPFGALRFTDKAGDISRLVCPPYDVINEEQRLELMRRNPYNIVRLELPREGENPYKAAENTLKNWMNEEILACDEKEAIYIYEQQFEAYGQTRRVKGFTCRVKLEEFDAGIVLPHEDTLSKAKADRFDLMCATGCNLSPIYSLYFDGESEVYPLLEKLSSGKPDMEFKDDDGVTHRMWIISSEADTAEISSLMSDKKIYIADGHHRYETALNYRRHLIEQGEDVNDAHPANYVMMTLVNMENEALTVFPIHRIVRGLDGFDREKLLGSCERYFKISDCDVSVIETTLTEKQNQNRKAFVLYEGKTAKLLTLKDESVMIELLPDKSGAYRNLDVSVLHTLILERLLGIDKENMLNQKNLVYTRDASEAMSAVDNGEADCAFIINPTKVEEIAAVAGASEKMPQKSSYFYPKLITGLTFNRL